MFCLYNKNPFLFIHIPKTAGGSLKLLLAEEFNQDINKIKIKDINFKSPITLIKLALKNIKDKNRDIKSPLKYHASYSAYSNLISKKTFAETFKFAVIRNPFDRFFSLYKWHKNMTQSIENSSLKEFSKKSIIISQAKRTWGRKIKSDSFKEFVLNFSELNKFEIANMVDYGILNCDEIIKFETLNQDCDSILNKLSINKKIPHIHRTEDLDYREFYDDNSKRIVSEIYKKDLSTFGYSF